MLVAALTRLLTKERSAAKLLGHMLRLRLISVLLLTLLGVGAWAQIGLEEIWRDTVPNGEVCFSPNFQYLVAGLQIRSATNQRLLHELTLYPGDTLKCGTVTGNSQLVAIATSAKRVELFNIATGQRTGQIDNLADQPNRIVALVDLSGRQALMIATDSDLEYWQLNNGHWTLAYSWPGLNFVRVLAVSPDKKWAVVTCNPSDIRFYSLQNLSQTPVLNYQWVLPKSMAFSSDSKMAFGANELGIVVFTGPAWAPAGSLFPDTSFTQVAVGPDGLLAADPDGRLQRSGLDGSGKVLIGYACIGPIVFSGGGRPYYPCGVGVYSYIDSLGFQRYGPGQPNSFAKVAISPAGTSVLALGFNVPWISYWNLSDNTPQSTFSLAAPPYDVQDASWSQDGQYVVAKYSGYAGQTFMQVYSKATGSPKLAQPRKISSKAVTSNSVSSGPGFVAFHDTTNQSSRIAVMRLSDFQIVFNEYSGNSYGTVSFSRDGTLMLGGTSSGARITRTSDWTLQESIPELKGDLIGFDYTNTRIFQSKSVNGQPTTTAYERRIVDGLVKWVAVRSLVGSVGDDILKQKFSSDRRMLVQLVKNGSTYRLVFLYAPTMQYLGISDDPHLDKATDFDLSKDGTKIVVASGSAFTAYIYCLDNPFPTFASSMSLTPSSVTKGQSSTLTVSLTKPAPEGGAVVTLSDNTTSVWTPASVTIPEGAYSATTTLHTVPTSKEGSYLITGRYLLSQVSATLTILP